MGIRREKLTDHTVKLYIQGRLDVNNSPVLRKEIAEIGDDTTRLIMDFRDVTYISSAGLRVLLNLEQNLEETGGLLEVSHVSELIRDVFDITGFLDILHII